MSGFPDDPSLVVHDPLGYMLGVEHLFFSYTFADAVKVAGHACPTVAGAFLMAIRAMERLFPGEVPVRGEVRVIIPGKVGDGVNGPISQIFTLITGAAAENGFKGLGGLHNRQGLLRFDPQGEPGLFRFERIATGGGVGLRYAPAAIPAASTMSSDLALILAGVANADTQSRFALAWRQRVLAILADRGENTLVEL